MFANILNARFKNVSNNCKQLKMDTNDIYLKTIG